MKKFSAIFVLAAIAMTNHVMAATRTWTGNTSTSWADTANWVGGLRPTSSDDAVIPANLSNYPVLSSNISIRSITLNGGSLTTNNYNITLSNDLIINDGVLDAGTGWIICDDIDLNNGELIAQGNRFNLNNGDILTIDGGLLTVTGTDLYIDEDLRLMDGILDLNGYNLTVDGTYTYIGGYVQEPGDFNVDNIIINFFGQHFLGINLYVRGNFNFTNGILSTDADHLITFDYNASVSNASNQSHIVGPVKKEVNGGSGTSDFTFPIGDGTYYCPLRINNYSNRRSQDYFIATYYPQRSPLAGDSISTSFNHVSQAEWWDLERGATSGTPTTTVRVYLYYDENENSGSVTNYSQMDVAHWNGTLWEFLSSTAIGNNTSGYVVTNSNVSNFSPFTLGSTTSANPLPIVLLNFDAKLSKNEVAVNWSTSAELNNDYFQVEKSLDGINWVTIQVVKGAGNSETINNYNTIDPNPVNGVQYYRLKQVDFNGKFEYSAIVPVNFNGTNNTVSIFPIPANNSLNVSLDNPENAEVTINIYNTFGQVVLSVNGYKNFYTLDISQLNSGVYTVEVACDATLTKTKLIKN